MSRHRYAPRTRRLVSAAALLLASAVFAAVIGNQALVARILEVLVRQNRSPVFGGATLSYLTLQHLEIVGISSALTLAVGLPLGIWVTRPSGRDFLDVVSAATDFGQVFPPIAVLALMLPVLGLGLWPAVVALFLYGLLPVVSATVAGIDNVSESVLDAARGIGMGRWQVLFQIELPLAADVILAGIRTSVIINVGTATVAAATGAGGLGLPIFTGITTQNIGYVLEGALTVSLLALIIDQGVAMLGVWVRSADPEGGAA